MAAERLKVLARPALRDARMVLGFAGWMNGGDVSTGVVETLIRKLDTAVLAQIDSEDFYILSFPGSMEVAALFRPHTQIEGGLVKTYRQPANTFFFSRDDRLILFLGREPHLKWTEFVDCIFTVAELFSVSTIFFIGSVGGLVPHTRQPRLSGSVSDERLLPMLERLGAGPSNYEGPASISTYLTRLAGEKGIAMATLVAEIPAYAHGTNPRCIEAVTRRLAAALDLKIDLSDLLALGERFEEQLNRVLEQHPDLKERLVQLEENYDNEVFDQMGDLKDWLEQKGIRLD